MALALLNIQTVHTVTLSPGLGCVWDEAGPNCLQFSSDIGSSHAENKMIMYMYALKSQYWIERK